MKKTILFAAAASVLLFASCGGDKTEATSAESKVSASAALPVRTITAVFDSLGTEALVAGKEIKIQAYSWGVDERPVGTININLSDEKAETAGESDFQARFPKEKEEELKKIPLNATVVITGTLVTDKYGSGIENCTIISEK